MKNISNYNYYNKADMDTSMGIFKNIISPKNNILNFSKIMC